LKKYNDPGFFQYQILGGDKIPPALLLKREEFPTLEKREEGRFW
jgi:hypothetical protein